MNAITKITAEEKVDQELNAETENVENIDETVSTEADVEQAEEVIIEANKDEYKEKFYYLAAEMENLKRRQGKELENTIKYGSEKILKGLIDVVDNFERTVDALKTGMYHVNIFLSNELITNRFYIIK